MNLNEKSSTLYQLDIEKFNKKMNRIHFTVVMKDGQTFSAYNILLRADSTFFTNGDDSSRVSFLTEDIHSFEDTNHFLGGIQGIFIGSLGGFVIFGGTAYLVDRPHSREDIRAALFGIGGGLLGGFGGLLYGAIHGYTDVYELRK